jgi:hypothetical protein
MPDVANNVYVRRILPKGHGYPVYGPKPDDNLPQEYRDRGTSIGDLVLITADGTIDFLFNICLPADHPVNDGRTPQCFEMVNLVASTDLSSMEDWHAVGSTIASSSVKKMSLTAGATVTAPSAFKSFFTLCYQILILSFYPGEQMWVEAHHLRLLVPVQSLPYYICKMALTVTTCAT